MNLKGSRGPCNWGVRDLICQVTSWAKWWSHGVMCWGMIAALNAWWVTDNMLIYWKTSSLLPRGNSTAVCPKTLRWDETAATIQQRPVSEKNSGNERLKRRKRKGEVQRDTLLCFASCICCGREINKMMEIRSVCEFWFLLRDPYWWGTSHRTGEDHNEGHEGGIGKMAGLNKQFSVVCFADLLIGW